VAITSKQIVEAIKDLTDIEQDLHLEDIPEGAGFWWKLVHLDPAIYRGVVVSVVGILTTFGLIVSDQETGATVTIIASLVAIIQAVWTRGAVTANQKVLAYKPDPVDHPTVIAAGDAVSSDVISVANAAAKSPGSLASRDTLPFPITDFGKTS
jgi:hypothetical protein